MTAEETWCVVPSLPQVQVSSLGRVMVIPHKRTMPRGGERTYGGNPVYGQWDGKRYLYVYNGRTYKVARLVCEAFNGPAPSDKPVCMHMDEDSRNNTPANLQWGTQKENLNAPRFIEYCKQRTGKDSPRVKGRLRLHKI